MEDDNIFDEDEAVRSFRFQYGDNKSIQISPVAYQNGNELTETVLEQIEQRKLVVHPANAYLSQHADFKR